MSLALEKFIASSADASMRACLFRWFEAAGLSGQFNNDAAIKPRAERRRLRAPPLAPTPEQTNNLDKQESRINAQEALLQRELRDIETELQHQVTGEASRRVSQSRSFDLGASVNESILAAELRHVETAAAGAAELEHMLHEVDEHRAAIARLAEANGPQTDVQIETMRRELTALDQPPPPPPPQQQSPPQPPQLVGLSSAPQLFGLSPSKQPAAAERPAAVAVPPEEEEVDQLRRTVFEQQAEISALRAAAAAAASDAATAAARDPTPTRWATPADEQHAPVRPSQATTCREPPSSRMTTGGAGRGQHVRVRSPPKSASRTSPPRRSSREEGGGAQAASPSRAPVPAEEMEMAQARGSLLQSPRALKQAQAIGSGGVRSASTASAPGTSSRSKDGQMSREPSLPGSAVLLHPFEGRTSGGSAGSVDPRSAEAAPRPVLFGEVATGSGTSQLLSNPSERPTGVMRRRVVRAPHKEGLGGRGGGGGSRDGMVAAGCGNGGARAKRSLNTAMRDTRLSGGTPSKGQGGWRVDINGNPLPPSPGKIVLGTAVAEEEGEDDDDDEEDGEEYDEEEDEDEEWEEFVLPEDDQRPSSEPVPSPDLAAPNHQHQPTPSNTGVVAAPSPPPRMSRQARLATEMANATQAAAEAMVSSESRLRKLAESDAAELRFELDAIRGGRELVEQAEAAAAEAAEAGAIAVAAQEAEAKAKAEAEAMRVEAEVARRQSEADIAAAVAAERARAEEEIEAVRAAAAAKGVKVAVIDEEEEERKAMLVSPMEPAYRGAAEAKKHTERHVLSSVRKQGRILHDENDPLPPPGSLPTPPAILGLDEPPPNPAKRAPPAPPPRKKDSKAKRVLPGQTPSPQVAASARSRGGGGSLSAAAEADEDGPDEWEVKLLASAKEAAEKMAAIDTYLKEAQAAGERAQSVHAEAMEEAAAEARRIEEEERRLLEERKSIEEERKQRRIRAYEALNRVRSGELSPEDQSPHGGRSNHSILSCASSAAKAAAASASKLRPPSASGAAAIAAQKAAQRAQQYRGVARWGSPEQTKHGLYVTEDTMLRQPHQASSGSGSGTRPKKRSPLADEQQSRLGQQSQSPEYTLPGVGHVQFIEGGTAEEEEEDNEPPPAFRPIRSAVGAPTAEMAAARAAARKADAPREITIRLSDFSSPRNPMIDHQQSMPALVEAAAAEAAPDEMPSPEGSRRSKWLEPTSAELEEMLQQAASRPPAAPPPAGAPAPAAQPEEYAASSSSSWRPTTSLDVAPPARIESASSKLESASAEFMRAEEARALSAAQAAPSPFLKAHPKVWAALSKSHSRLEMEAAGQRVED